MRSLFNNNVVKTTAQSRPDYVVLSNEELTDGKVKIENEVVIYAKLNNFTFLESLSREDQEQYSYSFNTNNSNGLLNVVGRVRKTVKDNLAEYSRTTKVFSEEKTDNQISTELSVPSTDEEFNLYKTFCPNGMIKSRFFLPITLVDKELVFEIDCYPNPNGGFHEWVKIDLELPEGTAIDGDITKVLPEHFSDFIVKSKDNTEEEKATISKLYQDYFLTKL